MVNIQTRLDNDDHYDGGNTHEYIVMHDTGNVTDTDEGNANYFCTGSRQASAHYFVDDDSITQIVLDNDCSWHCGDGGGRYGIDNRNSIGIEMCRTDNVVSATTEANAIDLVKTLMTKYNVSIDKVVRHYDASRKICPSSFSPDNWSRWWNFKAKLVAIVPSTPIPSSGEVFRVRKTWDDIKSQIGAYTVLDNAKALADKNAGYFVFSGSGIAIYPVNNSQPIPQVQPQPTPAPVQPVDKIAEAKKFIAGRALELQQKLNKIGYHLVCDSDFGQNTYNAVIDFQSKNGLVQDGLFGSQSWSKLESIIVSLNVVKPTSQPVPVVKPQQSQDTRVAQLQHNLNRLFNSALVEDNSQGALTSKAMSFASGIFGVSGLDSLLSATNQVLSFPFDAVEAPHLEYATRYITYRLGLPISGVYDGNVAQKVANWQSGAHIGSDGKFGGQSWTQIMK